MAKSNDEIYDLLVALTTKVEVNIAQSDFRLTALERLGVVKRERTWHVWTAIASSPLVGAVLALAGFKAGV